ncbi:MAG: hypothetical protein QOI50_826 [Pseudonocardiales bacterium]|nr:hypothetical protein [Pseudonocardiales bacterium]MDT7569270.1 hypothetical protein [Pseudonocardiales bacterium]MDT7605750.1 hypothetical protein [Pseudonocardiales bacterium]MDT7620612.1 hypothetical protein [Pseudonocardiales bacterium]MDT7628896.1 hypothetical protein [Pseudonocardiales bacterium]
MSFLDKAKEMLGKHDDKVDQGMDKLGGMAKGKFQGHDEQIDKATQMGKDYDFGGGTEGGGNEGGAQKPPPAAEQPPAQ